LVALSAEYGQGRLRPVADRGRHAVCEIPFDRVYSRGPGGALQCPEDCQVGSLRPTAERPTQVRDRRLINPAVELVVRQRELVVRQRERVDQRAPRGATHTVRASFAGNGSLTPGYGETSVTVLSP
jgi:hypothetical protein